MFKNIVRVMFVILLVFFTTACSDWSLKRASKHQAETRDLGNENTQNVENAEGIESQDTATESLAAVDEAPNQSDFQSLVEKTQQVEQGEPGQSQSEQIPQEQEEVRQEDQLILCGESAINCDNKNYQVCAKIKFASSEDESEEWLEFNNPCLACANPSQTAGKFKLEVLGYKIGSCGD